MTISKNTKKALFTSFLPLLLCVSMLIGTTFAWFTDSVDTVNNIITAGNLDVELYYQNDTVKNWEPVDDNSNVFKENTLWEPGHTEVVYLKIVNKGTLALTYTLSVNIASETAGINVAGQSFKLSDYIYFDVIKGVDGETNPYANRADVLAVATQETKISVGYSDANSLEAESQYVYFALIAHMPTTVGNDANHDGANVPQIDLGINVYATQVEAELDSFDENYDQNAPIPNP